MENDKEGLQNKLDTPDTKVWTRTGSKWDKVNPTIKCEWIFKETDDPKDVFESVNAYSSFYHVNYIIISFSTWTLTNA